MAKKKTTKKKTTKKKTTARTSKARKPKAKRTQKKEKTLELWSPERLSLASGEPPWKIRRECEAGNYTGAKRFSGGWAIPVVDGVRVTWFNWDEVLATTEAAEAAGMGVAWLKRLRQAGRIDSIGVIGGSGETRYWLIYAKSLANPRPTANGREFEPRPAIRAS